MEPCWSSFSFKTCARCRVAPMLVKRKAPHTECQNQMAWATDLMLKPDVEAELRLFNAVDKMFGQLYERPLFPSQMRARKSLRRLCYSGCRLGFLEGKSCHTRSQPARYPLVRQCAPAGALSSCATRGSLCGDWEYPLGATRALLYRRNNRR